MDVATTAMQPLPQKKKLQNRKQIDNYECKFLRWRRYFIGSAQWPVSCLIPSISEHEQASPVQNLNKIQASRMYEARGEELKRSSRVTLGSFCGFAWLGSSVGIIPTTNIFYNVLYSVKCQTKWPYCTT